ncbi:hypothetical protein GLOTRDRAFT_106328 [Gloeophyllum trabeum ATCC 11539]|uniref:tRNA-splicing endonuclease subunit Sen15 domain-containing protein n=1 Tax=Gloeophyllum trabeum (strain ATCC 11539 / FP-39264 / Madison 617) TaxID=670483 RepID=S7Q3U6_GLOTA|nr:uncharacterized protein GLOTRDRAFT_106328 [Gloeophyllum trabeum ATCC 11539]EPQ54676.1 hypothetical protein GLOTRDRAFT_106328 [Gloeophyllum trabeum ATCC 11539]
MDSHPSFAVLSPFVSKYPRAAGSIFQAYNDLLLAQQWKDLEVIDLPKCSRCGFRGRKPETDAVLAVIPCSLSESISLSWLQSAFDELERPPEVYVAITVEDSSIVYYKVSPGIVKPPL